MMADHFSDLDRAISWVVCLCLRVCPITYELNELWSRCVVCWFHMTISRSCSDVKVLGQSSRSQDENVPFPL